QYIAAARTFARTRSPGSVMCIGLRSIGSILAHIVAAALRRSGVTASVRSIRPRGDPFDRRISCGASLRLTLKSFAGTHFAVVDEGPGLSGSSFASVADALCELGVAPGRIAIFPSWHAPEAALTSARGRLAWRRHPIVTEAFDDVWVRSGRLFGGEPV